MKTSYLILVSLAAAVVAAPESDCSERRDSREVCPMFLPCNHLVVCASCATAVCPYCSGAVQSQITVANES